jgi:menaquinone-dependent protoporphyrinogen IX oxidase
MYDDFYFTNKSWCQLAGMDVRTYSKMESVFIQMVDFDFIVSSSYYDKYCQSLYNFIQGMQKQLSRSYDQILRIAYEAEETDSEIEV